jgi:hypothetical protein
VLVDLEGCCWQCKAHLLHLTHYHGAWCSVGGGGGGGGGNGTDESKPDVMPPPGGLRVRVRSWCPHGNRLVSRQSPEQRLSCRADGSRVKEKLWRQSMTQVNGVVRRLGPQANPHALWCTSSRVPPKPCTLPPNVHPITPSIRLFLQVDRPKTPHAPINRLLPDATLIDLTTDPPIPTRYS